MTKKEFVIDGHTFTLRKTSRKVAREMAEYTERLTAKYEAMHDLLKRQVEGEEFEEQDVPIIPDEFEIAFDMFCIITDGPHEVLDLDEFDIKVAEEALESFIPARGKM